jgi:dolichol-phosphate mannosyltransferase
MVGEEPDAPSVSVIVTAHAVADECQWLRKTLLDRASASGHTAEVIVVETRSPAPLDEGKARAVSAARGAFVAFIDPARRYSPETLPTLIGPLAAGTADLAIAACDAGLQGTRSVTLASRISAWFARWVLWPVAQVRDPWSGCYALRRERLLQLARQDRTIPTDLPAVLLAGGPDLRIAEVAVQGRCRGAPAPALREMFARLRAEMIGAVSVESTRSRSWISGATGVTIDLVTTLALLTHGTTLAASNIAGFVAGTLGCLAVRAVFGPDIAARTLRRPFAMRIGRQIVVAALALGFRGGAVAAALAYGLPGWLAVIAGLGVAWLATAVGAAFYMPTPPEPGPPVALRWSIAAVGIAASVVLLHILYLKVFPLTPEEAYYWNYSIRLDYGYLDHPPMVAWLIALEEALFGHGEASVRFGSLACGLAVVYFVYRFARRLVDRPAALLAAALAAAIPYSFFATGLMITPDAPLAAAWAASLYFLHRALIGEAGRSWYCAGIALGLGLLSKYTIATLGPAVLAFCILDRRARGWLLRPEPYLALLIAVALFAPVTHWNYANDWASFRFQSGGRFGADTRFSLHHMMKNILLVATPLPVLTLPLLLVGRWIEHPGRFPEPAHAQVRNRLFVGCLVFVPLAVFTWSALRHLPRLNWTGPIWLATLPLLGWAIVRADALRRFRLGVAMRLTAGAVIGALLVFYAALSFHMVLGIPGVPYPRTFARTMGWAEAARHLGTIHDRLARETGASPVIVGMDRYFIASELSFFGTREYLATGGGARAKDGETAELKVTTITPLSEGGLMFAYWDPPETLRDRTLIMVARRQEELATDRLARHFRELDPTIHRLPLTNSGYGGDRRPIDEYVYRIGYGYRPPTGTR